MPIQIETAASVRLDLWLWAARFYKTRALAKDAIEGGKVHCRGERCKPGKEPKIGDEYVIRTGFEERTVTVISSTAAAVSSSEEACASVRLESASADCSISEPLRWIDIALERIWPSVSCRRSPSCSSCRRWSSSASTRSATRSTC